MIEIDKPDKARGASNRDVLERDVLLIQAALYDRGFVSCRVSEPRVEMGAEIVVTFVIDEGPR